MTTKPAIITSATTEANWARALYIGWARHGDTPIWDALTAEMGNPLSVQWRAELAAS